MIDSRALATVAVLWRAGYAVNVAQTRGPGIGAPLGWRATAVYVKDPNRTYTRRESLVCASAEVAIDTLAREIGV